MTLDNKDIYILLNHLKSSVGDDRSETKRIAQIFGVLDIVDSLYRKVNGKPYLLMLGDFNSNRKSPPLNDLEKAGFFIINYNYNVNDVYTTIYKSKKEDIDYVIFNKQLYDNSKIKQFKVFHDKSFNKISDHYPIFLDLEIK